MRFWCGLQKSAVVERSPPRATLRRRVDSGPLCKARAESQSPRKGVAVAGWKKTVLCIDDDQSCLNIHKIILEDFGYAVLTASSAREGLDVFASKAVDAVILDYQMPEMNGELVAAEMRKTNPRVPILMFSGCVSPPESALQLVDEFIAKGEPVEFLLLTVQQLLSHGAVIHSRVATERVASPYGTKLPPFTLFRGPFAMPKQRKRIGEELRRCRNLFDSMAQGIIGYDAEARIISANPAAERILGVSFDALLGRMALDPRFRVTHEDGSECSTATHPALVSLKSGRNADGIVVSVFNARDGQQRWINMAAVPQFRPRETNAYQVYTTFDDITERRALKEELAQAQKMEALGRLAGGVAHDFNNLLNVISGYSELLLLRMQEGDLRGTVEKIHKAAATAASLTGQLLAFSRREVLAPRVLDLNRVVAEVARMLPRLIGENIEVATVLSPDLGRVKVNLGQIEQVILNLAANARDAIQHGGKLTIQTKDVYVREGYSQHHAAVAPGRYVSLAITDTGKGMDQSTLSRIFEPYFTTKERGKGTGLGMAVVYGIVDQNGGHIWVNSEPEQGTKFEIYLPRVEEAAAPAEPAKINYETLRGSETILLVEDSEDLRQMTCTFLRMQGYTVVEATNGAEAVGAIQQYKAPIHLMLTDVILPGMSGLELAKRVESLRPDMKVLCASGYTGDVLQRYGISQSNIPFIEKPFSFDFLAQKVRQLLEPVKLQKSA